MFSNLLRLKFFSLFGQKVLVFTTSSRSLTREKIKIDLFYRERVYIMIRFFLC